MFLFIEVIFPLKLLKVILNIILLNSPGFSNIKGNITKFPRIIYLPENSIGKYLCIISFPQKALSWGIPQDNFFSKKKREKVVYQVLIPGIFLPPNHYLI
jgi:hypothetical protein